MDTLLIRSIPLSRNTVQAWRENGCRFLRRSRDPSECFRFTYDAYINLGNSEAPDDPRLWNPGQVVRVLSSPAQTREALDRYLPPPNGRDVWIKYRGRAGRGKTRYTNIPHPGVHGDADIQRHIDGQEYRVVTVGDKVVQVTRRDGENGDRRYTWVGVRNCPTGIIPLVKGAVRDLTQLTETTKLIVGWDVIREDEGNAYILEGNTCPGVNVPTAERVLSMVERMETNANHYEN